jgi:haloalkane dehalogenase
MKHPTSPPALTPALRTPEHRFAGLPGFGFEPHYLYDLPPCPGLRVHHLDEGPRDAATVALCLHGNPSWSYLYRHFVPVFAAAGLRVVAPDLIGFGRSDKPASEAAHSFELHRETLLALIERLDLRNILLVCQDWGGLLGLTLPMAMPERFSRLFVMNTALAVGRGLSDGFLRWRAFNATQPDLDVAALFQRSVPTLSDAEAAAYAAPFAGPEYKAALRVFPSLVPDTPDCAGARWSQRAAQWWRQDWRGRSFMAVGAQDPVLPVPAMEHLAQTIRGCPAPLVLPDAGHFVQEAGAGLAQTALQALGLTAARNR